MYGYKDDEKNRRYEITNHLQPINGKYILNMSLGV